MASKRKKDKRRESKARAKPSKGRRGRIPDQLAMLREKQAKRRITSIDRVPPLSIQRINAVKRLCIQPPSEKAILSAHQQLCQIEHSLNMMAQRASEIDGLGANNLKQTRVNATADSVKSTPAQLDPTRDSSLGAGIAPVKKSTTAVNPESEIIPYALKIMQRKEIFCPICKQSIRGEEILGHMMKVHRTYYAGDRVRALVSNTWLHTVFMEAENGKIQYLTVLQWGRLGGILAEYCFILRMRPKEAYRSQLESLGSTLSLIAATVISRKTICGRPASSYSSFLRIYQGGAPGSGQRS